MRRIVVTMTPIVSYVGAFDYTVRYTNDMTSDEEWRPVVGHEDYFHVSSLGRIRSLPKVVATRSGPRKYAGQILSQGPSRGGYPLVRTYLHGEGLAMRPHVEVMAAFVGPRPDGYFVCHNNGNPKDNRLANLRYDTPAANSADTVRHGRHNEANKTHCKWGHPFDAANTRIRADGNRSCRACRRRWERERVARLRTKELAAA